MNHDQINRAVAESLGWTNVGVTFGILSGYPPDEKEFIYETKCEFSTSLDAIRAAALERFKTFTEQCKFQESLTEVSYDRQCFAFELTAADWCEAYLRAVVKWREE